MNTQINPTATNPVPLCGNLAGARVRVFFQAGEVAVADFGYTVLDSLNGEVVVSGSDPEGALKAHVAQHYPGWELIDFVSV